MDFVRTLAAEASAGRTALLLAPLGAGKTHTLVRVADTLREGSVPFVFIDLFTAASTPECLLGTLSEAVRPFMEADAETILSLSTEGALDRHRSSTALLRLLELLAKGTPSQPFIWLIDEVTEIRSLAYFKDLAHIELAFATALGTSRGSVLTSSYLGLAADLFPDFERVTLPGLHRTDLAGVPSLRSDSDAVGSAIAITLGFAATLLPLVDDMRETRDLTRSLVDLLRPGGRLELVCRRHYEVLLMRSRGYAVAKRAAEVVARLPRRRLTDLFPLIGRTAGASRQYLRWLVEVGLLTQNKKRYDFADPMLGLWARLYLGRGDHPTEEEIANAVGERAGQPEGRPELSERAISEPLDVSSVPKKRVDRFEEID